MTGDRGVRLGAVDLGRMGYREAYEEQLKQHARVLAARDEGGDDTGGEVGVVLLVEHDPAVITVSRREGARDHLVATEEILRGAGVVVEETDRGGDITYHGPGQLVAYPVVDLNRVREGGMGLHAYVRALEAAAIDVCARFGVEAGRDPLMGEDGKGETGVWVGGGGAESGGKVCAIGIRVRRWVTMHGLALNVTTDLDHFRLIVPCGLDRPVTSLEKLLGDRCPSMEEVKGELVGALGRALVGG